MRKNHQQPNHVHHYHAGFTLIETFVAITVLAIAVIGPLSLLAKAISDGNFAKQQITAFYLAQEAMELVIGQRDENMSVGNDWLLGLENCIEGECAIWSDLAGNILVQGCGIDDSSCAQIYQTEGGHGIYTCDCGLGAIPTPFHRTIEINRQDINGIVIGAEVKARVKWKYKGVDRTPVDITTFIANQALGS